MPNRNRSLFPLAALFVSGLLRGALPAQVADGAQQPQPAPIERAPNAAPRGPLTTTEPAPGIWLRLGPGGKVDTVAAGKDSSNTTEIRIQRGIANITVHQPAEGSLILVDLPGGQVSLLKDGLYTFNVATKTVRVLRGEADAWPATDHDAKPIKVKEDHAVAFGVAPVKAVGFDPFQARADLLPGPYGGGNGYRGDPAYAPYRPYGYGPYGDGFYGYGYGYPYYGYGYPYGWGYPYLGFGFGYYGGFGGYRGGFGGFRGRR